MSYSLDTPLSSQKIFLDSQYATTKISNSNMIFNLNTPIETKGQTHVLLALESASIPLSFYLVDDNSNTLLITDSVIGAFSVVVEDGNYNINQLVDKLNLDATIVAQDYVFTWDTITSKMTLTNNNNQSFVLDKDSSLNYICGFSTELDQTSDINFAIAGSCVSSFEKSVLGIYHCADLYIPRIREYFEFADVAGLAAPKPLVIVQGKNDPIFPKRSKKSPSI